MASICVNIEKYSKFPTSNKENWLVLSKQHTQPHLRLNKLIFIPYFIPRCLRNQNLGCHTCLYSLYKEVRFFFFFLGGGGGGFAATSKNNWQTFLKTRVTRPLQCRYVLLTIGQRVPFLSYVACYNRRQGQSSHCCHFSFCWCWMDKWSPIWNVVLKKLIYPRLEII